MSPLARSLFALAAVALLQGACAHRRSNRRARRPSDYVSIRLGAITGDDIAFLPQIHIGVPDVIVTIPNVVTKGLNALRRTNWREVVQDYAEWRLLVSEAKILFGSLSQRSNRKTSTAEHRHPVTLTKSSLHVVGGLPTLCFPVHGRHSRTFLPQPSVLRAMCPAHCHHCLMASPTLTSYVTLLSPN